MKTVKYFFLSCLYYVNQGDSGGPSYVNDVQVGIVSYGDPTDCTKGNVYTRVSDFAEWIKSKIATTIPATPIVTTIPVAPAIPAIPNNPVTLPLFQIPRPFLLLRPFSLPRPIRPIKLLFAYLESLSYASFFQMDG